MNTRAGITVQRAIILTATAMNTVEISLGVRDRVAGDKNSHPNLMYSNITVT